MAVRIIRCWQVSIAILIAACLILLDIATSGPDIDGRTPSLADMMQRFALEAVIVGAFAVAAIGLFRWHKVGWWLSLAVDGLLGLAGAAMVVNDIGERITAAQEGLQAFHNDLLLHATLVLLCVGAIGLLLLTGERFLYKPDQIIADDDRLPPSPSSSPSM